MALKAEQELAIAKAEFSEALDNFGPLKFIQERPFAAASVAVAAGALLGLMRSSKIKTVLLCPPVLGLIKKTVFSK